MMMLTAHHDEQLAGVPDFDRDEEELDLWRRRAAKPPADDPVQAFVDAETMRAVPKDLPPRDRAQLRELFANLED